MCDGFPLSIWVVSHRSLSLAPFSFSVPQFLSLFISFLPNHPPPLCSDLIPLVSTQFAIATGNLLLYWTKYIYNWLTSSFFPLFSKNFGHVTREHEFNPQMCVYIDTPHIEQTLIRLRHRNKYSFYIVSQLIMMKMSEMSVEWTTKHRFLFANVILSKVIKWAAGNHIHVRVLHKSSGTW